MDSVPLSTPCPSRSICRAWGPPQVSERNGWVDGTSGGNIFPLLYCGLRLTSEILTYSIQCSIDSYLRIKMRSFPFQFLELKWDLQGLRCLPTAAPMTLSSTLFLLLMNLPPLTSLKMGVQCQINKSQRATILFVLDKFISKW